MAAIKIAQLTSQLTLNDTDTVIVETATSTNKMTVANLKIALGINQGGIEESGSNLNGSYIKYKDGTMICTGNITVDANSIVALPSGGFRTSAHPKSYAQPFTAVPKISCSMNDGNNDSMGAMVADYPPQPKVQCYAQWRTINSQAAVTRGVDYIAIGPWK